MSRHTVFTLATLFLCRSAKPINFAGLAARIALRLGERSRAGVFVFERLAQMYALISLANCSAERSFTRGSDSLPPVRGMLDLILK